jgi:hypothetical protein
MTGRKLAGWLVLVAGVLGVVLVAQSGIPLALYLARQPASPAPVKVASAPDGAWIRLEDARLRCDSRVAKESFTLFLAEDAGGAHPFVAQFDGVVSCEEAANRGWSGAFMQRAPAPALRKLGISPPGEGEVPFFTEAGRPDVARRFVYAMIPWALAGALGIVTGLLVLRAARRQASGG